MPTRSGGDGGCDFPLDPLEAPPSAPVFWLPQEDTSVVVLASAPAVLMSDTDGAPVLARATSRIGEEGSHSLYDLGNSQSIQLLQLAPESLDAPLAAIIPLGITGFDRLEAVGRLLAVLHDRAIPPDRRLTRQQRARARRMLQAFDGARDGATQQEIAQVIFRVGRVARDDWQASSTRHAVMSLLRDARGMVEGGYRKFLRHRHRH